MKKRISQDNSNILSILLTIATVLYLSEGYSSLVNGYYPSSHILFFLALLASVSAIGSRGTRKTFVWLSVVTFLSGLLYIMLSLTSTFANMNSSSEALFAIIFVISNLSGLVVSYRRTRKS